MKKIKIIKAQSTGNQRVDSLEIHIKSCLDTRGLSLGETAQVFEQEAQKLVDALFGTLPGGVFDRVAGLMLSKVASRFIVAHDSPKPAERQRKARQ